MISQLQMALLLAVTGMLLTIAPAASAQTKETVINKSPVSKSEKKPADKAAPPSDKGSMANDVSSAKKTAASDSGETSDQAAPEAAASSEANAAETTASDDSEGAMPAEAVDSSPMTDTKETAETAPVAEEDVTDNDKTAPTPSEATDIQEPNPTAEKSDVKKKSIKIKAPTVDSVTDGLTEKQKGEEQKRHMFVVTYNIAQPKGNTSKFIDKFSFEGFGFEYRFFLKKQLSLGFTFCWNTFERKEHGLFELDSTTTIEGTRIKIADLVQLAPTVQYHFKKQSASAVPFIGLNAGPYYTSQIVDWGWWYERVSSWQFGFSPEVGLRLTRLAIPFYLSVRYSYALKANDIDAQQTLGFNIGIAFLK